MSIQKEKQIHLNSHKKNRWQEVLWSRKNKISLDRDVMILNPCHTEYIKMPRPFLIISQSDNLILSVDINSHTTYLMANNADPYQMASSEAN